MDLNLAIPFHTIQHTHAAYTGSIHIPPPEVLWFGLLEPMKRDSSNLEATVITKQEILLIRAAKGSE